MDAAVALGPPITICDCPHFLIKEQSVREALASRSSRSVQPNLNTTIETSLSPPLIQTTKPTTRRAIMAPINPDQQIIHGTPPPPLSPLPIPPQDPSTNPLPSQNESKTPSTTCTPPSSKPPPPPPPPTPRPSPPPSQPSPPPCTPSTKSPPPPRTPPRVSPRR